MTLLALDAPAKLNLSLRVVGRRADGFHELDGVMLLLELCDRVTLAPGAARFEIDGPVSAIPTDAHENLAWRGLQAAMDGTGDEAPGALHLEKRVEAAAGLGGGSSDAAAAWRLGRASRGASERADAADLEALSRIGADVPFFAAATVAARVRGIGERIEPLGGARQVEVVLAHPPRGLATPTVFAAVDKADWSSDVAVTLEDALTEGRNDLWPAARRLAPALDDVAALVAAAGGQPRLTGSGPTIYAISDDPDRADGIARRLVRAGVRVTRTRSRARAATIDRIEQEET